MSTSPNGSQDWTVRYDFGRGDGEARRVINHVYRALQEKGYDPIGQMVGYLLSGDPTYITSHNGARTLICTLERDRLLEELIVDYLERSSPASGFA